MIQVLINNIDRTELIKFGSLSTTDKINNGADTAQFTIQKFGSRTFVPEVGMTVEVFVDEVKTYGGVILEVEQSMEGHAIINYSARCKDFSFYMDRLLVTERYQNTDLQTIILDLIDRYAANYGFTGSNVQGSNISVRSISFSEIKMTDCLTKLAKLTGYYWYVDNEYDLHFFKKNTELSPFNLGETSDNYIVDSLAISDDLSQIRNKVKITGGEAVAESRTEKLAGDGERDTFVLGHKFSELPTVTVNGVSKTVGVDYLQKDEDYDVMWSYGQKYIRFTAGHIPPAPTAPAKTNIDVSGTPLIPIVVQRYVSTSISDHGVWEHSIKNDSIKSRDEALQYALADLQSYADSVKSGSFDTYTPGLRSGQTITINIPTRGVAEQFMIQSVKMRQVAPEKCLYSVDIATIKTLSIIDALQKLLLEERISAGEDETLLNFFSFEDPFTMTDELGDITATETENYVIEQNTPASDSYPNPAIVNKCTISA